MRCVLCALLIALLVVTTCLAFAQKANWEEYEFPFRGFAVSFPHIPDTHDPTERVQVARSRCGRSVCIATSSIFAQEQKVTPEAYEALKKQYFSSNCTVSQAQPDLAVPPGYIGHRYHAICKPYGSPRQVNDTAFYMSAKRMFVISVIRDAKDSAGDEVQRFLGSFRFLNDGPGSE